MGRRRLCAAARRHDDAVIEAHLHQAQPTSLAMLLRATAVATSALGQTPALVHCESGCPTPDTFPTSRTDQRASSTQRRGRKRRSASKGQYRGRYLADGGFCRRSPSYPIVGRVAPFARRTALRADQSREWDHPRRGFPVEGGSKSNRVAQLPGFLLASLRPYRPSVFRRRLATLGVRFAHLGLGDPRVRVPTSGPESRSSGSNGV
jgi:hypothetical protein